jgi:hypothetical protein
MRVPASTRAAQHRLLADDRGVVAGIGRGRHRRDEGVQVGGAADAGKVAGLRQIVRHRHRIRGLTAGVEVEDRLIDGFVSGLIEVIALHRLDAVGDGVLRQEHRAEHALLGLDVLRRGPQTVIALIVAHLSSSSFKLIGTHPRSRSSAFSALQLYPDQGRGLRHKDRRRS